MTEGEAVELVQLQAQTASDPVLTEAEVVGIVQRTARAAVWAASTAYAYGTLVVPAARNGYVYRVRTAGTGGLTEPTSWPTLRGYTVTDGAATLEWYGLDAYAELYDTGAATAAAWRLKAAKAANRYNFSADGQSFSEQQLYTMCMSMAHHWMPMGIA